MMQETSSDSECHCFFASSASNSLTSSRFTFYFKHFRMKIDIYWSVIGSNNPSDPITR